MQKTEKNPIILDWTLGRPADAERAIVAARHRLHENELFSDAKIIETIDAQPREKMRINTLRFLVVLAIEPVISPCRCLGADASDPSSRS